MSDATNPNGVTRPEIEDTVSSDRCGFVDGWLQCDLKPGHPGRHEDHWMGGGPPRTESTDHDDDLAHEGDDYRDAQKFEVCS